MYRYPTREYQSDQSSRMLFSNELILDDKKMRKNIYGSGWGAFYNKLKLKTKLLYNVSFIQFID
ncbi:hypothetical protein FWJ33_07235 [Leptospira interrogans serovar Hardjo]|nr:hypothetical protein B0191_15485 [Leptospira interrogans serovar Hardjo]QEH99247.1 hypothetical protein FWJ33_07235 [Leptospira interrogans serovar Hardjo]